MLTSTKKTAEALGLSEYALRRLAKAGAVPFLDTGAINGGRGRMLFNLDAVEDSLRRRSEADRQDREAAALAAADGGWR